LLRLYHSRTEGCASVGKAAQSPSHKLFKCRKFGPWTVGKLQLNILKMGTNNKIHLAFTKFLLLKTGMSLDIPNPCGIHSSKITKN
jgi:hypothetical protein